MRLFVGMALWGRPPTGRETLRVSGKEKGGHTRNWRHTRREKGEGTEESASVGIMTEGELGASINFSERPARQIFEAGPLGCSYVLQLAACLHAVQRTL